MGFALYRGQKIKHQVVGGGEMLNGNEVGNK